MKKGKWTTDEVQLLIEIYPDISTEEVAKRLGRNYRSTANKANYLGLKKSEKYFSSESCRMFKKGERRGGAFEFNKGHKPWNYGMKGIRIGGEETQFKKGHKPVQTKYDGAITIHNDGNKQYQFIRISEKAWKPLHTYLWEKENGPIPKGSIVVFRDKDTMNCTIENLECITRAENMKRNSFYRFPKELRETIRTVSKLKKLINQHEK
jgi:hypothetical protein